MVFTYFEIYCRILLYVVTYITNLMVWVSSDQKSAVTRTDVRSGGEHTYNHFGKTKEENT